MNLHSGLLTGVAAALLAVCGTSAQPAPLVTERQKTEAMRAFNKCLITAARKLDTAHRSDATAVALAIQSRCAAANHRAMEVYSRDMNPEARAMFMEHEEENLRTFATTVVQKERALAAGR
jgi:uncharacterized membrane protein YccC